MTNNKTYPEMNTKVDEYGCVVSVEFVKPEYETIKEVIDRQNEERES